MQLIYTILLYLIQPFVWLKLFLRGKKAPAYRKRWTERYGFCTGKVKPHGILVHSVSMGESIAAVPLIKQLQADYPAFPITVTTMTPTGSAFVTNTFKDSVSHVYLPYDLPCALRRFLNTVQPKMVIIMETELWPNLITALHHRRIPLIIANARLSARSAKRYAKLAKSTANMLQQITYIAAQDQASAERFLQLGLPQNQLLVTGSIKFDISLSAEIKQKSHVLRESLLADRPAWIAASTHEGEEAIILQVHRHLLKIQPDLLLILVPRHPERFNTVADLLTKQQFSFIKRSENRSPEQTTDVILADSMGELLILFGLADIAFIGGSLVPRGGHNPLEAALHHLPIVMGRHVFNFQTICDQLQQAGGLEYVDEHTFTEVLSQLLKDTSQQKVIGEQAYKVLQANQGALTRLLTLIQRII